MLRAAAVGTRRAVRLLSSKSGGVGSDVLKGASSLSSPAQRERDARARERMEASARAYQKRRADAGDLENPFMGAQKPQFTQSGEPLGLEAQFRQMERAGEFRGLPRAGKPLKFENATAFGGDAMDEQMRKMMAKHKFKPYSIELRDKWRENREKFRKTMADELQRGGGLDRPRFEQWAAELDKLRDEHRSASVDDALRMSLPINNLPAIDIDEEIARAKENWFKL